MLRASCEPHREMTMNFERIIAREVFLDTRVAFQLRIKEPPLRVPMRAGPQPNAPIVDYLLPEEAPRYLSLFVADPPGILSGRARDAKFKLQLFQGFWGDAVARINKRAAQGLPHQFHRQFNLTLFARFLSKIAIGMVVYGAGLESFDPTDIRKVIVGEDTHWAHLVGGTPDNLLSLAPPARGHRITVFQTDIGGTPYAGVQIQLFAQIGTPVYTVIVGKLNEAGVKKFDPKDHILYA